MAEGSGQPVRVTVEKTIDGSAVDEFYALYEEAFGPLRTRAAARQVLHEHEFREEMIDPRIRKYVAWSADGAPIGLTTVTADLTAVPWISPEFYYARFAEYAERGVLYYVGFTLVKPVEQRLGAFTAMLRTYVSEVRDDGGMMVWDICAANHGDDYAMSVKQILETVVSIQIDRIDAQIYYAARAADGLPAM